MYKEYLHHGGTYFMLFLTLMFFVISQIATTGNDYWVSFWTNMEDLRQRGPPSSEQLAREPKNIRYSSFLASIFTLTPDGLISTVDAIKVYTFCIVMCIVLTLSRSYLFMKICMDASKNLHNTMFSNLLQARMFFFNTNPSGERDSKMCGTSNRDETVIQSSTTCRIWEILKF